MDLDDDAVRRIGMPLKLLVKELKLNEFISAFDSACRRANLQWALFGGTAINKVYLKKTARFSEDADFSVFGGIAPHQVLQLLKTCGAQSVSGPHRISGDFWRFELHYSDAQSGIANDLINFDANLHLRKPKSEIALLNPHSFLSLYGYGIFLPAIPTYTPRTLVAMKLLAIGGRAEGRDFYDLYHLLKDFPVTRTQVMTEAHQYRDGLFNSQRFDDGFIERAAQSISSVPEAKLAQVEPFLLPPNKPDWRILKGELKRLIALRLGK